ncbi:hypothetical protein ACFSM5_11320 [Lacibacterium aquatile]|uniref:SMODS-associating 2TM beta-strand rich effector domain-containing protein n=1 Tax=Lacibacterium aquatile TaxID=1168082 RepID=A0ABW5DRQ2_9PROT
MLRKKIHFWMYFANAIWTLMILCLLAMIGKVLWEWFVIDRYRSEGQPELLISAFTLGPIFFIGLFSARVFFYFFHIPTKLSLVETGDQKFVCVSSPWDRARIEPKLTLETYRRSGNSFIIHDTYTTTQGSFPSELAKVRSPDIMYPIEKRFLGHMEDDQYVVRAVFNYMSRMTNFRYVEALPLSGWPVKTPWHRRFLKWLRAV